MENLPSNPDMLLSILNLKLRDSYATVQDLCDDMNWDYEDFMQLIDKAGLEYFNEGSRFVKK